MKLLAAGLSILLVFSIGCNKKSNNKVAQTGIVAPNGGAVIAGNVSINQMCGVNTATIQLFAYQSNQPMYSTQASQNGTYQFQVQAGTYTLTAYAGNGCAVSGPVQAYVGQVKYYDLNIANYGMTGGTGYNQYPNQYPCQYGSWGCTGTYPGNGGVVMGKPNIYFEGSLGQKFNLKLKFEKNNTLLAAVPAHGEVAWDVELAADQKLNVMDSYYDFLFYDANVDVNSFQNQKGFCNSSTAIVGDMVEYLKAYGFNAKSVSDFEKEWTGKVNKEWSSVCAFVQEDSEISKMVSYETEAKLNSTRVWFLLAPQMDQAKIQNKFFKKPQDNSLVAVKTQAKRAVASEGIKSFEWGVGFLLQDK